MRGIRWICLGLIAAGCTTPELQAARRDADAAEAKLAEVRQRQQALARDRDALRKQRQELSQAADALGRDLQSALAAVAYFDGEEATGEEAQARAGFELEQALARGDLPAATAVAEHLTEDAWRCASRAQEDSDAGEDPCRCDAPKFDDECAGVEDRRPASPSWKCATVVPGEGVPPLAFCTAAVSYPAALPDHPSAHGERLDGEAIGAERDLIRTAFLHDGRLHVADHPAPSPEVYAPPNTEELVACALSTSANECRYQCEERFNRYQSPCGCGDEGMDGDDSFHSDDDAEGQDDEPEEVREAREAARRKAADAERALAESEEAQQELAFQECSAQCFDMPQGQGAPPTAPASARVSVRFERSPAPGILLVQADKSYLSPSGAALGVRSYTWVLQSDALVTLGAESKLEANQGSEPAIHGLRLLAEYEDERAAPAAPPDGGEAAVVPSAVRGVGWTSWPETGDPLLVGFESPKTLSGVVILGKKGAARVTGQKLCQAVTASKLPAAFVEHCRDGGVP